MMFEASRSYSEVEQTKLTPARLSAGLRLLYVLSIALILAFNLWGSQVRQWLSPIAESMLRNRDIAVVLSTTLTESDVQLLQPRFQQMRGVAGVQVFLRSEVFDLLKTQPELKDTLTPADEQVLPSLVLVQVHVGLTSAQINNVAQEIETLPGVVRSIAETQHSDKLARLWVYGHHVLQAVSVLQLLMSLLILLLLGRAYALDYSRLWLQQRVPFGFFHSPWPLAILAVMLAFSFSFFLVLLPELDKVRQWMQLNQIPVVIPFADGLTSTYVVLLCLLGFAMAAHMGIRKIQKGSN